MRPRTNKFTKALLFMLVVVMVASLFVFGAFAEDGNDENTIATVEDFTATSSDKSRSVTVSSAMFKKMVEDERFWITFDLTVPQTVPEFTTDGQSLLDWYKGDGNQFLLRAFNDSADRTKAKLKIRNNEDEYYELATVEAGKTYNVALCIEKSVANGYRRPTCSVYVNGKSVGTKATIKFDENKYYEDLTTLGETDTPYIININRNGTLGFAYNNFKVIGECAHTNNDKNSTCDYCGEFLNVACDEHKDEDKDNLCDVCGKELNLILDIGNFVSSSNSMSASVTAALFKEIVADADGKVWLSFDFTTPVTFPTTPDANGVSIVDWQIPDNVMWLRFFNGDNNTTAVLKMRNIDNKFVNDFTIYANQTYKVDICVEPLYDEANGYHRCYYSVYIDDELVGRERVKFDENQNSLKLDDLSDSETLYTICFNRGKMSGFAYENIKLLHGFAEPQYDHIAKDMLLFFDNGVAKYSVCDCGERTLLETKGFASCVVNNIAHIYNGGEGELTLNSSDYWFVTDVNVRGAIGNGTLVKFADTVILEVKNGKIVHGDTDLAKVTYPTSYQVAVKITDATNYDLYFNGMKVASGSLGTNDNRVYLGDASFGYHVRFMYTRAVTLADTAASAVTVTYDTDASVKLCYHQSKDKAKDKYVVEANGVVTQSYICTECGERVYAKLTNTLVSYDNDEMFGFMPDALLKAELNNITMTGAKVLYLEDGLIGKNAAPYSISFTVTPNKLPTLDGLNDKDPNGAAVMGYNLVSAEASFYPVSALRVVPTADGAEIRIIRQDVANNSVKYDEAVATLAVGSSVGVTLCVNPATGAFDVYIGGEYKASSKIAALADYEPQIHFHDNGAGEFVYSNITVATEANTIADSTNAFEIKASYVANKTKPKGYTSLASVTRTTANASYRLDLVFVDNRTGELCFKDINGKYRVLTDNVGKAHKLSSETTSIIVIYDDIKGTVRYYIGDMVAYYKGNNAMEIPVNEGFANAEAINDRLAYDTSIVSKIKVHGMESSGVMQVVALQQRVEDGALRIVAGVDIPWYGSVGYRVALYNEDGQIMGKEVSREGVTMFKEIYADDVRVSATKVGYNYFVPLAIKCGGELSNHIGDYFMITPYVTIGNTVIEGKQVKVVITEDGYRFAN